VRLFLSRLTLAFNHPRAVSELDHPYELHRTLCKGFDDPVNARILFRPEADAPRVVHVIVQSFVAPDWSKLDADPKYLDGVEEPKQIALAGLREGLPLRFRLRCRPSKRIGMDGNLDEGKRRSLKDKEEIFGWLYRKGEDGGFRVTAAAFDRVYWFDSKEGRQEKPLGGVVFDGELIVTEAEKLRETVANGIGPQKAYGFGLLSLAPVA